MTHGYRIQFLHRPPVTRTPTFTTVADPHQRAVLQAELSALLGKGAIREVASGDQQAGFFSRYFLTPKRDGGLRPILDLRGLNQYLRPLRCWILTVPRVRQAISAGDWFAHLEGSLALPTVRLCRQNVQVSGAAVRYLSGTSHLHSLLGCGSLPPETQGHQGPELPRRLAGLRSLRRATPPTRSPAVGSRSEVRPVPKLQEEQARAGPGDHLLGHGPGLKELYSCPDPGEAAGFQVSAFASWALWQPWCR